MCGAKFIVHLLCLGRVLLCLRPGLALGILPWIVQIRISTPLERMIRFSFLGGVKNLLTVLSSRGGQLGGLGGRLGSTWPAAAEDKEMDKCAEETRSN